MLGTELIPRHRDRQCLSVQGEQGDGELLGQAAKLEHQWWLSGLFDTRPVFLHTHLVELSGHVAHYERIMIEISLCSSSLP